MNLKNSVRDLLQLKLFIKEAANKFVYLVYSGIIMSFSQGGTGVPCTPLSVSAAPLCCHLPALLLVVGGGGQVYSGEMRCIGEWVDCGRPGVPT